MTPYVNTIVVFHRQQKKVGPFPATLPFY